MRYTKFDYDEEYLMYLDVDIIVLKPLIGLIEDTSKGIYIDNENTDEIYLEHYGYLDAFNDEEKDLIKKSDIKLGVSSGKFIIKDKVVRDALFQEIHTFIEKNPNTKYYTLEQPIFNRAIRYLGPERNIGFINNKYISTNFHNMSDNIILIDLCGEPGNGRTHLCKMINGILALT
jgi:hypothetical protein